MHEQEARAERDRLLVGLLGESAAADAHGEAEVVADQRARPGLSADAAFVHHEDAQPLRGAVDGRREARGPGAHDDHVEVALLERGRGTYDLGDLGVGRVAQKSAVGKHHQRELRVGACPGEQLAPLVRRRQAEGVRGGALLEDLPQLVGPAGPCLAHDVHRLRNDAPIPRPLEQETRDGLVEDLVEGARRPRHVVVDASKRHRVADRVGGRLIRPDVRRNEQRPPGVRVQLTHVLEEVTPRCRRQRRGGEHERHVLASVRELLQRPQRVVRIAEGLDPIVVGVPLDELRLDAVESVQIFVDGEQDRQAHRLAYPNAQTRRVRCGVGMQWTVLGSNLLARSGSAPADPRSCAMSMGRAGIEPATLGLKVPCSTN